MATQGKSERYNHIPAPRNADSGRKEMKESRIFSKGLRTKNTLVQIYRFTDKYDLLSLEGGKNIGAISFYRGGSAGEGGGSNINYLE